MDLVSLAQIPLPTLLALAGIFSFVLGLGVKIPLPLSEKFIEIKQSSFRAAQFGGLALILVGVGVYGVVFFSETPEGDLDACQDESAACIEQSTEAATTLASMEEDLATARAALSATPPPTRTPTPTPTATPTPASLTPSPTPTLSFGSNCPRAADFPPVFEIALRQAAAALEARSPESLGDLWIGSARRAMQSYLSEVLSSYTPSNANWVLNSILALEGDPDFADTCTMTFDSTLSLSAEFSCGGERRTVDALEIEFAGSTARASSNLIAVGDDLVAEIFILSWTPSGGRIPDLCRGEFSSN